MRGHTGQLPVPVPVPVVYCLFELKMFTGEFYLFFQEDVGCAWMISVYCVHSPQHVSRSNRSKSGDSIEIDTFTECKVMFFCVADIQIMEDIRPNYYCDYLCYLTW